MRLVLADEYLEDEDLLEMMNASLIPMIVINSHKGESWAQIFVVASRVYVLPTGCTTVVIDNDELCRT